MARRVVVEVGCSRCDRKELREETPMTYSSGGVEITSPAIAPKALTVKLGGESSIEFDDLCTPCLNAVTAHLEAIGKKIEGLSPERKKKDEEVAEESKEKRGAKKKGPLEEQNPSSPTAPPSRSP